MERCPLCGAETGGLSECRGRYFGDLLAREYMSPGYGHTHLLTVDAYVLQHSEDHSPRSNALHLTRLAWLLFCGGDADIRQENKGPMPYIMEKYYRDFPFLQPPPAGKRGSITVIDAYNAKTSEEHSRTSREWGMAVWDAYSEHHEWAGQMLQNAGVKML